MTSTPFSMSLMPLATAGVLSIGKENVQHNPSLYKGQNGLQQNTHHLNATSGLLFIYLLIHSVRSLCSGSNISIFITTYLPQNNIISGFKTFIVVFGDQHLNSARLWLQTAWKLCLMRARFSLVFHLPWPCTSAMNV